MLLTSTFTKRAKADSGRSESRGERGFREEKTAAEDATTETAPEIMPAVQETEAMCFHGSFSILERRTESGNAPLSI